MLKKEKTKLGDDLRAISAPENMDRKAREQAKKIVEKIVTRCTEQAIANAGCGMNSCTVPVHRPMVNGNRVPEKEMVQDVVDELTAEGINVTTEIREEHNMNTKMLFIRMEW